MAGEAARLTFHELLARFVNWVAFIGFVWAPMTALLTWVSSHFSPIAQYGWSGIVLFAIFGASLIIALLGLGAAMAATAWRQLRPVTRRLSGQDGKEWVVPKTNLPVTGLVGPFLALLALAGVGFVYFQSPAPLDVWHSPVPVLLPDDHFSDRVSHLTAINSTIDLLNTRYLAVLSKLDEIPNVVLSRLAAGKASEIYDVIQPTWKDLTVIEQDLDKLNTVSALNGIDLWNNVFETASIGPHLHGLSQDDYSPIIKPYLDRLSNSVRAARQWRYATVRALVLKQQELTH